LKWAAESVIQSPPSMVVPDSGTRPTPSVMGIETGAGPQLNWISPPAPRAVTRAEYVQSAGEPPPTTVAARAGRARPNSTKASTGKANARLTARRRRTGGVGDGRAGISSRS